MDPGLQWFCWLIVQRKLLSDEQCRNAVQQAGVETDLLAFAQMLVDNGICTDVAEVQAILNEAHERGHTESAPPDLSFLGLDSEMPPGETKESGDEADLEAVEAGIAAMAAGTSTDPVISIPGLEAGADLAFEEAAEIMVRLLAVARGFGASDIHLSAGTAPFVRRYQGIHWLSDNILTEQTALNLNTALLSSKLREDFQARKDLNLTLETDEGDRYRVNLILHRDGCAGNYHIVPQKIMPLENLGFRDPGRIKNLLTSRNGLLLVTGPSGSGKTTTLAAMVDHVNRNSWGHVITVEDPLEVIHEPDTCYITQRELGTHTPSYDAALKGAL